MPSENTGSPCTCPLTLKMNDFRAISLSILTKQSAPEFLKSNDRRNVCCLREFSFSKLVMWQFYCFVLFFMGKTTS